METDLPKGQRLRPATAGDADDIRRLAIDNGMLSGYLDGSLSGHSWIVLERDGNIVGAAYYAPEPFAGRLWNLYFIAAHAGHHGTGVGHTLITHVESELRLVGEDVARVLIVETSSLAAYEPARTFYRRNGFDEEARIRDFYGPGDDKIVYWKALTSEP
jgi:ribosomal protein S18 acetylase RimI-like enzyme